jgi:uncharacterized repeat protein (TIGR01451 family)
MGGIPTGTGVWPFGSRARVSVGCVALCLGIAAPVLAWKPTDGAWTGSSAPSRPYSFTVLGGGTILTSLNVGWTLCGGGTSGVLTYDIPISASNTFSTSKTFINSCPAMTTSGTFTSPTTATGTLTVTFGGNCSCSGTQTLTWSSTKVPPQANLSVTMDDGQIQVIAGTTNVYTIIVTNQGPEPVTSLTLRDTLPTTLLNPVFAPSMGTYNPATWAWTGLSLSAGQAAALTLTGTVAPNAFGQLSNTVYVAPPAGLQDPNMTDNQVTHVSNVFGRANLALTVSGPSLLTTPSIVTWRIAVTNNGPSDAQLVQVQDDTPPGLTFVSNSGACATAFPCSLATVPAGQTRTIDATFSVPADYTGPNPISNTARAISTTTDLDVSDNTATGTIQVVPPAPASSLFTIEPCRLLDTRAPSGPYGGPALAAGEDRTFVAIGPTCGIPAAAQALSVNVTVTGPTAAGNLRLYAADFPLPQASTVNYSAGQTRANNAIVPLNASGEFAIHCAQASGIAHAIVDVNGYYAGPHGVPEAVE